MLIPARLRAYLDRIGVRGDVRPDLPTLTAIHRAHIFAIPYEDLDIQLGRVVSLEPDALFDKLVTRHRGGFCYEQNGTLAAALRAIGFRVTMVEGAVDRITKGENQWRNHMPLLVDVDGRRLLADAGLGLGFIDPLPLAEGTYQQGPLTHRLTRLDDATWRCFTDEHGRVPPFDFHTEPRDLPDFDAKCHELCTSPDSGFVTTLTVQQPRPGRLFGLRARTLRESGPHLPGGKREELVAGRSEFVELLDNEFNLSFTAAEQAVLWDRAATQHADFLAARAG